MKRVYESPVMMLEGFEANEYVAACYAVICNGYFQGNNQHNCGGGVLIKGLQNNPQADFGKEKVNGGRVVASYTINGAKHWEVVSRSISTEAHPNASM